MDNQITTNELVIVIHLHINFIKFYNLNHK
jgi:hypothetical protein